MKFPYIQQNHIYVFNSSTLHKTKKKTLTKTVSRTLSILISFKKQAICRYEAKLNTQLTQRSVQRLFLSTNSKRFPKYIKNNKTIDLPNLTIFARQM